MNQKLLITAIASLGILYIGYQNMMAYRQKAEMQIVENNGVVSLRETWATLENDIKKWNEVFPIDTNVRDLSGVYNAINIERHQLKSENLMLSDAGREIVDVDGSSIGLSKTCLINSSTGFTLKNEIVSFYTVKLRELLQRSDIDFGTISMRIDVDKDFKAPYVTFDKLCVVLRGYDTFLEGIYDSEI